MYWISRAAQPIVDRHRDNPGLDRGLPDLEHLVAVVEHDGDLVAAGEAERAQRVRELIDALVPPTPGVADVAEDDGRAVGTLLRVGAGTDLHGRILRRGP